MEKLFVFIRSLKARALLANQRLWGSAPNPGVFLGQVSARYPDDHILMVVDGASSHKAKALQIPDNLSLILLPAYSPQLNPQENVWDEIREKNFPNRVFSTMAAVHNHLRAGLAKFAADAKGVTSLTAWPWIRNVLS